MYHVFLLSVMALDFDHPSRSIAIDFVFFTVSKTNKGHNKWFMLLLVLILRKLLQF